MAIGLKDYPTVESGLNENRFAEYGKMEYVYGKNLPKGRKQEDTDILWCIG